ncbi:unnamed protein product [Closterium sp. NIES-54]
MGFIWLVCCGGGGGAAAAAAAVMACNCPGILYNNFFSCGFSTQPDCTQTFIAVQANCLGAADVPPCLMDPQRVKEVCASFCGLSASTPSCAGHGTCFFSGPNRIPTCACLTGYANGELPGTCMAAAAAGVTPADFSFLTSISISSGDGGGAEMAVSGAAAVQADSSVVLTSNQQAAWGAAFLVLRVRLFSYDVKNHSCGREIALKLSFSFSIAPATGSNGVGKGGLAFVLTATDSVPGGDGSTVGYAGMDERSLVVEFDTFQDASSGDPSNSHVGFNIGGSVISIATAAVPELNTGSTKYAWIEYSPVKGGLLSVYVASAATRPAKPVLTRRVSLCDVLKPTFEEATFVLGFTAASSDPPKEHTVLQWSLDTSLPLGFTLAEATFTTSGVNRFFRYASAGALQPPAAGAAAAGASAEEEQQWAVATNMTWIRPDLLPSWPVPNQAGCGDCWAYVVVASIEAVYAILSANGSLPVFSVSSLVAEMKADCSGGSPSKAFQYLLAVGKRGGGLQVDRVGGATGAAKGVAKARGRGVKGVGVTERSGALGLQGKQGKPAALTAVAAAAGQSQSPLCSPLLKPIAALLGVKCTAKEKTVRPGYSIRGFERAAFYSWFGLVLAVQRQPVVVHIQASADSFLNYDGDPACFTYNLNHVVLLVGYRLVGSDEAFPHMAPPFWIIRNSWGADWGDGGHMRMDIQGGDGVCGINTLPGVYPIISGMLLLLLLLLSLFHTAVQTWLTKEVLPHLTPQRGQNARRAMLVLDSYRGHTTQGMLRAYRTHIITPAVIPARCTSQIQPLYVSINRCFKAAVRARYAREPEETSASCGVAMDCGDWLSQKREKLGNWETLATYFSLASTCPSPECTAAFQALNPGVDCGASSSELPSSQAVCVERRVEMAGLVALCSQYYFVESAETCESIRNVPDPPLSRVGFYRLNPGIKCIRLVPKTDVGSFTGFEVSSGVAASQHCFGRGKVS